jgi:hypothetical protein
MVLNCRSAATITGMKTSAFCLPLPGVRLTLHDRADVIIRVGYKK